MSSGAERASRSAQMGLTVLTLINLFNYLDRYVVASLVESLKKSELRLSDAQAGLLMTGYVIVYMLTSPIFGTLGDRLRRPPLLALGVGIWSMATALGGLARSFAGLFATRATVGVGEAAYGTIAPALRRADSGRRLLAERHAIHEEILGIAKELDLLPSL